MAQQTNFVKLSIMQIEILNIWFGKPILVYEIKSQTWATPIDGVYISELPFAQKTQNLKAK